MNSSTSSQAALTQDIPLDDFSQPYVQAKPLPPVDTGPAAFQFLAGAFVVEALVWGYPNAYGILQDYYTNRSAIGQQLGAVSKLVLVGPISSGLMYLTMPFVAAYTNRFPRHKPIVLWGGALLCCIGILSSAFATNPVTLVITQGVIYGLGGVAVYAPTLNYLTDWFVDRRGMANGVLFSGTGLAALTLPFIFDALLSRYSAKTTMIAYSIALSALFAVSLPFIRPRIPLGVARASMPVPATFGDINALKTPRFWVFILTVLCQGLGFFIPGLYLPSYAESLGYGGKGGTVILAAVNAMTIFSTIILGALSDRYSPHALGSVALAFSAVTVLALWGALGHIGLAVLVPFGALYGMLSGGWSSLWFSIIKDLHFSDPATVTILNGITGATRGLGNILVGPIASVLLRKRIDAPKGGFSVDHDKFSSLIVFSGCSIFVAAIIQGGLAVVSYRMKKSN